jgi:hypothetical protein
MARRKVGNSHTTISIKWEDKEQLRKYAKLVKKTKNGDMYESDSVLFNRILGFFKQQNPTSEQPKATYPQGQTQQNSSHEESTSE